MTSVRVEPLTGAALASGLDALADLRITVFRDWPYLYDGDRAYERRYLEQFAVAPDAIIVAAFDGERMVGAATGAAMTGHFEEFAAPFAARGFDPARIFYCAESVLLPDYRGRGLGHRFFDEREAHARTLGTYHHAAFCAVIRPDDHPLKPSGYRPLNAFWAKRGYRPVDGAIAHFAWTDVGEAAETEKPMQFWMKPL